MGTTFIIDFENALEVALLGIRKAYYFTGLVYDNENLKQLKASHPFPGFLLFPDYPIESISELMEAFKGFIITNSIREIIEAVAAYLDAIFFNLELSKCKIIAAPHLENAKKATNKFSKLDFPIKIVKLDECLIKGNKISKEDSDFLIALQQLRNCMTHKRNKLDKEMVTLSYPCFEGITEDGKKFAIDSFPIESPLPSGFRLQIGEEKRDFKKDEVLSFSHKQVALICLGAINTCQRIKNNAFVTGIARRKDKKSLI